MIHVEDDKNLKKIIQVYEDIINFGDSATNNVRRWLKFVGHVDAYAAKYGFTRDEILAVVDDYLG